ncbi:DNA-binding protein [Wenyingzhuangia sp. 2_MG-2023]|uniref:DNA-binding protein n=1 Tax=Wenyingzhuangia sp. 2_MG-2023 TaxID=3062639 RepID=UPI0026E14EDF|nr:DNA-binding protein [Wenyingzhuangia sp. 2_MG-2023]MDO6737382.1 DNA-binding protein [Wenyingzhuangia sp. 2_MG-2023]
MNRNEFNFEERFERLEKLLLLNQRVINFELACLLTGFSKSKMYKLTSNQEESGIPAKRPTGGAILFDKKELEDWCLRDDASNSPKQKALDYVFNSKR